jgi:ornithine cyclodeaminase/alanine dehydrogenase-like protein (mu-crystallin family)
MLILTHDDVHRLLPIEACIEVMADALRDLSQGNAFMPLRTVIKPPESEGLMALMPAAVSGERAAFGLKALCVFEGNTARGLDLHQGGVLLFSAETGQLQAVMSASAITEKRTPAVSALATRVLARDDAGDLAIIGAGRQGRAHLAALAVVRTLTRVRVADRDPEAAARFAAEAAATYTFPVEAVPTAELAVRDADLIVTTTTSHDPVIRREWVSPGAHINAVGASQPDSRELDAATVAAARFFVDRRESTINESADYLAAFREGAITADHIQAELGEVLLGRHPGRTAPDQITLFKSLGLAVEDVAAAYAVYQRAGDLGVGTTVEF